MVRKETVNVNGKEIIVYNVTVKDETGEEHIETGITDATFNMLLPDGYGSDREKYREEYSFDANLDFYIPDEVAMLSDNGIVSYLNECYGDDMRRFINTETYEGYKKDKRWLEDEITRLQDKLAIVERKMKSVLPIKEGDLVLFKDIEYYVEAIDLGKEVVMLRNTVFFGEIVTVNISQIDLLKKKMNKKQH